MKRHLDKIEIERNKKAASEKRKQSYFYRFILFLSQQTEFAASKVLMRTAKNKAAA